jgi:antirestriction protein ArdC
MKMYPLLRYYRVFNTEQCAALDSRIPPREVFDYSPLDLAERVVKDMPDPPIIRHEGQQAYYSALVDLVTMPSKNRFHNAEGYYSTLFHELTHSTGHPSRLNRLWEPGRQPSHTGDYSKEELIAEMGASFLCDHCRIGPSTIDNSAAYIDGWLQSLQNDPHMVVYAGAKAQRAADYILGLTSPKSSPGT